MKTRKYDNTKNEHLTTTQFFQFGSGSRAEVSANRAVWMNYLVTAWFYFDLIVTYLKL